MTITIKKTLFVHKDRYSEEEYCVHACDMSEYGYVMLGSVNVEFEFTLPSHAEQVRREVEMLNLKKSEILAETHRKVTELQERIDSLLCIENKG